MHTRILKIAAVCALLVLILSSMACTATVDCNTYCEQYAPGCYRVNCLSACTSCSGNTSRITGSPGSLTCSPTGATACNGTWTNTASDNNNCGTCGNVCPPGYRCSGSACTLTCKGPLAACSDQCIDVQTSVTNCGGCGNVCSSTNGSPSCTSGACGISCNAGYGNCDSSAGNGCETNTTNDPANCGSCGTACNHTNGTATCASSSCGINCYPGFGNCNSNLSDGCETNTSTTVAHCGVCGQACSNINGTPVCTNGACAITCSPGFGDCDNNARSNGCETDTRNTVAHCGRCGSVCPTRANATPTCNASTCGFTCNANFGDCDMTAPNGCEIDLRNTVAHCGACGQACSTANGTPSCANGACAISCSAGFANCDNNARSNGCETNTSTDINHCGSCGNVCNLPNASEACTAGACAVVSCSAGFGNCNGNSTDGCETNINTTVAHCGACAQPCSTANGTPSCANGTCAIACVSGYANCDNNARSNGCETNTSTDINHCGSCGNVCNLPNASEACTAGACTVASCSAGFGNCNGISTDGCETNTNTSVSHCGGCGRACSLPNATPVCVAGTCAIGACSAGFANCNGNSTDGCEINTRTDKYNCGSCGHACGTLQTCFNGTCI